MNPIINEISKYYKYCRNIEFWCLNGHKYKILNKNGIKILDSDKIKDNLQKINLNKLAREIEELKRPC